MPSQFFGLNIAASGLRAANAAQNTTANNIANAQTPGYSRQMVIQEANDALRTFTTYGCAGAGVDTIAIQRMRDGFYDTRFRNNNTQLGFYSVKQYYTKMLEDYFEDDQETGFSTAFSRMMNAIQGVLTNQNSTNSKQQFIGAAKSLTEYFNNTYGNLQKLQEDMNDEIKLKVGQINSAAEQIATLNKQINIIEMSGGTANELRDQRDKLVDDLSKIVNVETEELPIVDSNNPDRVTGGNRFVVSIAGGYTLVDGYEYNSLECVARRTYEKVNQTDVDGLYDIQWTNGNSFSLTNPLMGGELQGLIEMRDGNNSSAFEGRVVRVGRTDDNSNGTVTVAVNRDYLQDMSKCTLSDTGGKIKIGNQVYYYSSWEYDEASSSYTFTLDDDKCDSIITTAKLGQEAYVGDSYDYQGIPYYMEQMNEWVRDFTAKVNEIFTSGYNSKGEPGCYLFTGNNPTGGQYGPGDFTDQNGNVELTAGNFAIWSPLLTDADLLGTRQEQTAGSAECKQMEVLKDTLNDKDKFSFRNMTAGDFLECILSDTILNSSNADTLQEMYQDMSNTIEKQRGSISGVDEDEEAQNMVKFRYSYSLASKMIQTLTEMYDQLILQTGV